jgi:hypothetical protein
MSVPASLRRLHKALLPLQEFDLVVTLTEKRNPGITIEGDGWNKEMRRIIAGEEENTFSFSNTMKCHTSRRNLTTAEIKEILSDSVARYVVKNKNQG